MKKNVGDFDAYLRLLAGFSMLGYGIMRRSRMPIVLGSMKIAEGITRFCPMLAMLGITTIPKGTFSECCCEPSDEDMQ